MKTSTTPLFSDVALPGDAYAIFTIPSADAGGEYRLHRVPTSLLGGGAPGPAGPAGPAGADGAAGPAGPAGAAGAAGPGVVIGGTTGQFLRKASNADYDTAWDTLAASMISDATATGLAVLTAATTLAARQAITGGAVTDVFLGDGSLGQIANAQVAAGAAIARSKIATDPAAVGEILFNDTATGAITSSPAFSVVTTGLGRMFPHRITLSAGNAAAGGTSLKFQGGALVTTPEVGALEALNTGDDIYYTIATGTARKRLVMADPVGGLTSGRVPYATTNGRLTDGSNFTFSGTRLSPNYVTLAAGAAAAGSAPLLFTSGTLLSTPVAGALEFLTDILYFTQTTGTTRKQVVLSTDGSATASTLTVGTDKLLGRDTAGTGAIEEISVAGGLQFSSGTLTGNPAINAQTGTSYTLVAADDGKLVSLSNVAAITLTVPGSGTTNYAIGTQIMFYQRGAGQVTVAPGGGVVIRSAESALKLRAQYSSACLFKLDTDEWLLVGDIIP